MQIARQTRLEYVDQTKAVLIFLVVLGHLHYSYAPAWGKDVIYAFHVPAFLIVTGFLLPRAFALTSLNTLWSGWIRRFMAAYFAFSALSLLIGWTISTPRPDSPANLGAAIISVIRGVGPQFIHDNAPLWYFPFLITSLAAAWCLLKLPVMWATICTLALLAASLWYSGPRLYWGADIAGIGAALIVTGWVCREYKGLIEHCLQSTALRAFVIVASGVVLLWIVKLNGSVNLNGAKLGASPLLFVSGAVTGSVMIVAFAASLPTSRLWQCVSKDTLAVFALHIYLVRAASRLPLPDNQALQQVIIWLAAFGIAMICVVLARISRLVFERLSAPWPSTLRWKRHGLNDDTAREI